MLIDLSHTIEPGMPSYPGLPEPVFGTSLTHDESAERQIYAPGTTFQVAKYELGGNTGTYIDAPFHRHREQADLAEVKLASLADLPGVVITAPGDGPIGGDIFGDSSDFAGRAVLVRTGWSKLWGRDNYFTSGPFLTAEACTLLHTSGAALVGIDCANIDDMTGKSRPAHTILLAANVPIVEHLCNLESLPSARFRFFAAPPAIRGGTSFPVRAFAIVA